MSMQGERVRGTVARRVFLQGAAGSAAVALLAACGGASKPAETPLPIPPSTKETLPESAAFSVAAASPGSGSSVAEGATGTDVAGALFAMTNATSANAVVMYYRLSSGKLNAVGSFKTGGTGIGATGDGAALDSQGSLALSQDGKLLFAVNAGSGDISTFVIGRDGLTLTDRVASRGPRPISLTVHGSFVYVLNFNRQTPGNGNITGFAIGANNRLTPLVNGTRALSSNGNVNPGQVLFNPSGSVLVVSEKETNRIVTYIVGPTGIANEPSAHPATGQTPFGMAFNARNVLVCTNAASDTANNGSVSSYIVSSSGGVTPVGGQLANRQTAPCWTAIDPSGNFAYLVNALSNSLTSCRIGSDGSLSLLSGVAAQTDKLPFDPAFSSDGRFLYVVNSGAGTISGFRFVQGGALQALGSTGQVLPTGAAGLAVI